MSAGIGTLLRRLGFARLSVRPEHPSSQPEAHEAFKKGSPRWCARLCPGTPAASRSRSGSRMVERGAFHRVGQLIRSADHPTRSAAGRSRPRARGRRRAGAAFR
jgi:hypothetical protein